MCEFCYQYRCPPSCPAYRGTSPEYGKQVAVCRRCGKRIYRSEKRYRLPSGDYCENCATRIAYKTIRKYE